ncbi:hypothetical protein N665_1358s0018 [Sinapis alba]|nr:hypothetical protein N665_1358s0018 [Sinapis alba]
MTNSKNDNKEASPSKIKKRVSLLCIYIITWGCFSLSLNERSSLLLTYSSQKKKILGPQWTEGELERFYGAYRKHGRDWKKNNRSVDMVEALFSMHRVRIERRATGKRSLGSENQRDGGEGYTPPNKRANIQLKPDDDDTRALANASSSVVSGSSPVSLPQKPPNRRKMNFNKSLQDRAISNENELLKEKITTCLSYPLLRRRCLFEWFYNAIDYPWFAKMEFNDFLNHLGLVHVPRLTRLEWNIIKSSLGITRRFSERFIQEERDKLKQFRESSRKFYTELRAGAREGLPTGSVQPLSVGNSVIAIHPETREIHDGKILSVDHDKCNVLFDELDIDLVMDIDCMPLHLLEYMRMQTDNCLSVSKEAQLNRHPSSDAYVTTLFTPSVNPPEKQGMELEMLAIVSGARSIAEAIVDEAMKAASTEEHQPLDHHHHHQHQMASELIRSCVSTCLMIQMCREKQKPAAEVDQMMEIAVSSLQPRCPQNMPIYREIETCMGLIKNQVIAYCKNMKK